jgi:hypothetical protein
MVGMGKLMILKERNVSRQEHFKFYQSICIAHKKDERYIRLGLHLALPAPFCKDLCTNTT